MLTVHNLVISNLVPVHASGTRVVNIANEPLLEAWLDGSGKRMATVFGKANTSYEVLESSKVPADTWSPGWTGTVPGSLSIQMPVQGALSNAPVLLLRAKEQ